MVGEIRTERPRLVETEDVVRVGIAAAWHEGVGAGAGDRRESIPPSIAARASHGAAYLVTFSSVLSCLCVRRLDCINSRASANPCRHC